MLNQYRREDSDAVLDERVSALLQAAAAPCEPGPLPGEGDALAAFRVSKTDSRRSPMLSTLTSLKAGVAAALGVGVLLTGGVGMAATGALPGGAQDTASEMLAKVGVTVPGADRKAAEQDRATTDHEGDDAATIEKSAGSDKGQEVSELARTTDLDGAEKGAAVSGLASEGRSGAGEERGEDASADGGSSAGEKRDGVRDQADQDGDHADGASGRETHDGAADGGENHSQGTQTHERGDEATEGDDEAAKRP